MTDFPARFGDDRFQSGISASIQATKCIGVALFNGFGLPDAATVVEIFQAANSLAERNVRYEVHLLSPRGGRVASSSSVSVWTEAEYPGSRPHSYSALFVAGGMRMNTQLHDEHVLDWLRDVARRAELLFPIAEGHLLLNAAGLNVSGGMPRHNPAPPRVEPYGFRPARYARTVSPTQAALAVVEEDFGADAARQIASRIEPTMETQFTPIVRKYAAPNISEKIQAAARWIELNCSRQITMDEAAQVAMMSGRNFLRRFKLEIGVTPSDYLLYVRLDLCCRLLADTNLPVDKIARRCGIGGGGQLSKIFRKYLATTPTEYRSQKLQSILPG